MATYIRTNDAMTEIELRQFFDMEPDEEAPGCIPVCAGEWRQEGDTWWFFADQEWEDDAAARPSQPGGRDE